MLTRTKRALWVVAGTLFLVLGLVGAFLPVLPTTPFLLLTAACWARGSQRFHHWLLHNPLCGSYIRDYYEGRGIPLRTKIWSMVVLWGTIAYTVYRVDVLPMRLTLPLIAVGVSIHVLGKPTKIE
jgi:uncharacterized protein